MSWHLYPLSPSSTVAVGPINCFLTNTVFAVSSLLSAPTHWSGARLAIANEHKTA